MRARKRDPRLDVPTLLVDISEMVEMAGDGGE